jgi:hypothetical protein
MYQYIIRIQKKPEKRIALYPVRFKNFHNGRQVQSTGRKAGAIELAIWI